MSIEALWSVQFTGMHGVSLKESGGVIVIESGKLFGGDTWQWYTGTYDRNVANGALTCRIQTGVHYGGGSSIFGGPARPMNLEGEIIVNSDQKSMTAVLSVVGDAKMLMRALLTRVAELP